MNLYWWDNKEDVHKDITKYVSHIIDKQSNYSTDNLKYLRLYGNYQSVGLGAKDYSTDSSAGSSDNRVTLNIVASMVDTVSSKITKNRPRPMFLTEGGTYRDQKKAEKMNKFVEGSFYKMGLYAKGTQCFTDACVFGSGFAKFYTLAGDIKTERVFPDEILVDNDEAIYGNPRSLYQKKYVHRSVLKEQFPKFKEEIEQANKDTSNNYLLSTYYSQDYNMDMVTIFEAWHLPSSDKSKDGRHVICIDSVTLFDEEWKKDYFPFVMLKWSDRLLGYYGQGIAEQLLGIQYEINKILKVIQTAQNLVSIPKIMIESGSKIVKSHLNNQIGGIVVYSGTKPSYETFQAISPELYQHLERLYNKAYEIIGVSQLAATSKKPSGLDSGVALREFNDIETERFMTIGRRYEQFYLDSAKIILDLAKDLSEGEGEYSVKFNNKKFIEKINFSEINLDEDAYEMKCYPTAFLPSTPAGKLQAIQELLNSGLISKEDGLRLLEYPDLDSVTNLMNSQVEIIDDTLQSMVDSGEYIPVEPYLNLELALKRAQLSYMRYKLDGVDDERLELIRQYLTDIADMLAPPQAPAAPIMEPGAEMEPGVTPIAPGGMQIPENAIDPSAPPLPLEPEVV